MKTSGGITELLKRFASDMKADYRKTLAMVLLAGVLVVVLIFVLPGDGGIVPKDGGEGPSALGSQDPVSPQNGVHRENDPAYFMPHHLGEALPLKDLGRNPFKPFFTATVQGSGEKPPPPDQTQGEELAQSEEKRLESIIVTCTVTGPGQAYAIVDGKILKVNDVHKGFVVTKISDRSVKFTGKTLSRQVRIDY